VTVRVLVPVRVIRTGEAGNFVPGYVAGYGKIASYHYCERYKGQNPLYQFPRSKLTTGNFVGKLL